MWYSPLFGGYRIGITENQLKGAPKYSNDNSWNWTIRPGLVRPMTTGIAI
jgi:hypothetical protein